MRPDNMPRPFAPEHGTEQSERLRLSGIVDELGSASAPQWWTRKAADQLRADEAEIAELRNTILRLMPDKNEVGLRERAESAKYGTTTERTDLALVDWLRHLQEELLDAAVYIEAALGRMDPQ